MDTANLDPVSDQDKEKVDQLTESDQSNLCDPLDLVNSVIDPLDIHSTNNGSNISETFRV